MRIEKNDIRHPYKNLPACILLSAISSVLIFIYYIFLGKGYLTLTADFNSQQIPFTIDLHNQIKNGLDGWVWNYELGQSLIKAFSFSAVGSPFFWISMLFPAKYFGYVVGWIYCLKYVTAAVCSYFYFIRFVKDDRYAVVGSMLYAFSGFQAVNLVFYSFHDVVALFPLLLTGLEKAFGEEEDKRLFVFAVFINCLLNYFFFVQEVVFLVIYFLFRFWSKDYKLLLKRIADCILLGLLGVGMAAVLFIPNVIYMLSNPRMNTDLQSKALLYDFRNILAVIKGMLLPAESLHDQSCVFKEEYRSVSCFLPMLGVIPLIAYTERHRDWLSRLLCCCTVMSLIPICSEAFTLFTELYYRWWYMYTLIMALAACLVFERAEEHNVSKAAIINFVLIAVFFVLVKLLKPQAGEESSIYHIKRLIFLCAVSISGAVLTLLLMKNGDKRALLLCMGISLFGIATNIGVIYTYKIYTDSDGNSVIYPTELGSQLEVIDPQYRYDLKSNALALTGDASCLKIFSSTRNEGSVELDSLFDYFSGFSSLDRSSVEGLTELLGGRYYLSSETDGNHIREYFGSDGTANYVMEKPACPIGFFMDKYILREDFDFLPVGRRGVVLLQAAVIDLDDESTVKNFSERVCADNFNIRLDGEPEKLVQEHRENAVTDFSRDSRGFSCRSDCAADTLIYFSVPYDKGWTAYIDGNEARIINSGGMMLLCADAGSHRIEFTYTTPGYKLGLLVSLTSSALFICLCLYYRKKKC